MANHNVQLELNGENVYPDLYDTGWVDVPLADGITASRHRVRKVGNIVHLDIYNAVGVPVPNGVCATIPVGFRPYGGLSFRSAGAATGANFNRQEITADGTVKRFNSSIETSWFDIQVSYPVD